MTDLAKGSTTGSPARRRSLTLLGGGGDLVWAGLVFGGRAAADFAALMKAISVYGIACTQSVPIHTMTTGRGRASSLPL